ncbi:MAG: hypothetical protein V2A54_03185 [Bacteroidota bacterium]
MRKLNCFIACAFGRPDVDEIYNKSLKKVLKKLNINALRVDKINHNENIDKKIIELIKKCDFCIADLTYARPSVYYEAGYVHGMKKEVIFTARKDHFSSKKEDHLKIHFDLLTKNIISWKTPNFTFEKSISERIKLITTPIYKSNVKKEIDIINQMTFKTLSLKEKVSKIEDICKKEFKSRGFVETQMDLSQRFRIIAKKTRFSKNIILFQVDNSFTEHDLYLYKWEVEKQVNWNLEKIKTKNANVIVLLISLMNCPDNRIHKMFPSYKRESEQKIFSSTKISDFINQSKFIFIDNVKSLEEVKIKIKELKLF